MRILFAGTPEIAVLPLETLAGEHTICGVLTSPDKPVGRGGRVTSSPVKAKADELGLTSLQPEKLDQPFRDRVKELQPEILVVVAYGKIFKKEFLDLFPLGGINVHPSLLPLYRGPSPLQAAILAGDRETGVTIQRLALRMDAGAILMQQRLPLTGTETAASLMPVAARIGSELLVTVLRRLAAGTIDEVPQDERAATYCKLINKEDGQLNWTESALVLERKVRAFTPWPGTYTRFKGLTLTILKAGVYAKDVTIEPTTGQIFTEILPTTVHDEGKGKEFAPGLVWGMDKGCGILVCTRVGMLCIRELQLQNKKAMDWKAFINGNRDLLGTVLGG